MLGLDPVRFAVIDVGTNSVKLHVGERRADGSWQTVADRAEVTRLGEGLQDTGSLQPEPLRRTAEAVVGMVEEARREGAAEIAAVATAGMRLAENSAELVEAVRERCGVGIEVISGEEEARLAYLAATSALDVGRESLVVFDTGGGSSEFTFGRAGRVEERFSVDVGAARYTERFGLDGVVSDDEIAWALQAIADDLGRLDGRQRPAALVGLGGALTNLAAVRHRLASYDPDVVQGTVLDRAEIDRQIDLYRSRTAERAAGDRRAAAGAGRGDPRRCVHRPDGARQAALRRAHGQRPRPPPRPARRAVQCRTSALSRTTSRPIPTFVHTARSRPAEPSRSIRA